MGSGLRSVCKYRCGKWLLQGAGPAVTSHVILSMLMQEPCSLSDPWFLTGASLNIALTLRFPPPTTPIPLGSLSLSFYWWVEIATEQLPQLQHVAVPLGLVAPRLNVSPKVVQSWQSMSSMSL